MGAGREQNRVENGQRYQMVIQGMGAKCDRAIENRAFHSHTESAIDGVTDGRCSIKSDMEAAMELTDVVLCVLRCITIRVV